MSYRLLFNMFTGLVEEVGTVAMARLENGSMELAIACRKVLDGTGLGDSVAVNGCCLTVTALDSESFCAVATPETLSLTNLPDLAEGHRVNLERSLTLNSHLGGHLVQGHIDGTGKVLQIQPEGDSQRWSFSAPQTLLAQIIRKGSITVNGVSLTVAGLDKTSFSVALIPATIELTTFKHMSPGERVNLETDLIGKYVFRYLSVMHQNDGLLPRLS